MYKKKIRFLLSVLMIIIINLPCFAQKPKDSCRYEIGIGIPDIGVIMGDIRGFNYTNALNASFKVIKNKNAFRGGITYEFSGQIYKKCSGFLINAGYERRFLKKNLN